MGNKIFYKSSVEKDLRKIDVNYRKKIMDIIENTLSKGIVGKKLKGEYKGLFSYRTGDYRILYSKINDGILILRIAHRKEVYK